jgi:hypothetical protein
LMPGKYYLIETRNIIWVCKIWQRNRIWTWIKWKI